MDTSLSAQSNKPMFGTSDFAVSPVDSSEYIDATAEETCPAESVPMSEQRAASETLSAASLEVMDQLKALAQNVTQDNHASLDESNASSVQSDKSEDISEDKGASGPGESQAPAPSISVFPRPTGFENNPVIIDRPKFGTRALTLAGFAVAALIGAGGTFAWQAHFKSNDVATTAAPAPVVPAPTIPPYLGRQLEELAQDVSSVRRRMEELAAAQQQLDQLVAKQQQLAAKQEQVGQSILKLQALEQARQRTPPPVQSRAAPVPPRPSVPPPPIEPTTQPPLPPRTATHPIPPLPVPSAR
ncbi:MAG TPA: hypothetical protein VFU70_06595 [Pseudolabrys sp.]|nr:hypothetical protein [Pseudolabrys sp.]